MISQPLPNIKTHFFQKEEVGSYDNIALNERYCVIFTGRWRLVFSCSKQIRAKRRIRRSIENYSSQIEFKCE